MYDFTVGYGFHLNPGFSEAESPVSCLVKAQLLLILAFFHLDTTWVSFKHI